MKKLISTVILLFALSIFSQADFGMKMRMRSELQNLNSTNSDKQIYERVVDMRFRPHLSYTVNDFIDVKAVFEIGDLEYGTNGGSLGTDGQNLETKNIHIDIKPTNNQLFRLGLMPYKDAHSMIIDSDLAGLMWKGSFNEYSVNLGWFAAQDEGERYLSNDTYSFGTSVFLADMGYELNEMFTFGVNNIFVLDRTDYSPGVRRDGVSIFFAPRLLTNIGMFHLDAQFVANNNYAIYNPYDPGPGYSQPRDPDKTGLALSVKSKFKMDEKTTFRANLLFRGCYENWENYQDYDSFYDTGLEIINEDANGISTHNPMDGFTVQSLGREEQLGIVVPSLFVDWEYMDNVIFTGGFGFILNDAAYGKKVTYQNPFESKNKDMFIAWELDLKAKVTMYEDNISFFPYLALMVPTDNFAYNKVGDLENFDENNEPVTDMQLKIGTTVKYNF
ncbi:MAG: hypothetical protein R6V47_06690 [Candidatus Delongbacteria bacterium]